MATTTPTTVQALQAASAALTADIAALETGVTAIQSAITALQTPPPVVTPPAATTIALAWAAPAAGATVEGVIPVNFTGALLVNVEVFDGAAMIDRMVCSADGTSASGTVDTTKLPNGALTLLASAWNAPAGQGVATTQNVTATIKLVVANGTVVTPPPVDPPPPSPTGDTIGGGTIATAAVAPAPTAPAANVGTGWTCVKNWDFGTAGTISNYAALDGEFNYHDEFGSYSGAGFNYGSISIASSAATAITGQAVEDPTRPVRTFTATEMQMALQANSAAATVVSSAAHDCNNGSFYSKFALPAAGSLLGQDILWEFMVRLFPVQAYWSSCWLEGQAWDTGAEIDVYESYGWDHGGGSNNFNCQNFHSDAVYVGGGGSSSATSLDFQNYPGGNGSTYHRFNLLYLKNDTWQIWCDDVLINSGTEHWTLGAKTGAEALKMYFSHDFAWGFNGGLGTVNGVVNQGMSPSNFPVSNFAGKSYGIQYSRVYLR